MGTQPLAGKTALVTGASRNIGRAIALRLAGAGAEIVVNTLQDRAAAERVAGEIAALGRKSLVQVADIVRAGHGAGGRRLRVDRHPRVQCLEPQPD